MKTYSTESIFFFFAYKKNVLTLNNHCNNHRYFLEETESNSRNYIENKFIKASNSVINLAQDAEKLLLI